MARSKANPDSELRDPVAWKQSWMDARARISSNSAAVTKFTRSWTGEGCA